MANVDIENAPARKRINSENVYEDDGLSKKKARITNTRRTQGFDEFEDTALSEDNEEDLQNTNAVPGRVCKIEMENFMCHGSLVVNFDVDNNNCFYIGGPNGSGKSAIFAGLNIGLGGKGSQNDRGSSLEKYIKIGTQKAKLAVTLTNTGRGRHPDYGEKILVERTILHKASSYVLKSVSGQGKDLKVEVVSRRKSDLDEILTRFGIQLNNPIFWMSQDRCRQFLTEMKPDKLYQIFSKATELEYTEELYSRIEVLLADIERGLKSATSSIMASEEEYKNFKRMLKKHEGVQKLQKQLDQAGFWLTWVPAGQAKKEKEIVEKNLKDSDSQFESIKDKIMMLRKKKDAATVMRGNSKSDLDKIDLQMRELVERLKDKMQTRQRLTKNLAQVRDQKEEFERSIQVDRNAIKKTEISLRALRQKKQNNVRRRDFEICEKTLADFKQKRDDLEERKKKLTVDLRNNNSVELRQKFDDTDSDCKRMKSTLKALESRKQDALVNEKDKLAKFGKHTSKIIEIIDRNIHRFQHRPVGPIGLFVSVKDRNWAFSVEQCLSFILKAWVFDNRNDEKILRDLMSRAGLRDASFESIITKFVPKRHDVRKNSPDEGELTVERMIEVTEIMAFNVLVDKKGIESVLLIENDREARERMDGQCPENVQKCFTLSGATVMGRTKDNVGSYRFYSNVKQDRHLYFLNQGDDDDDISRLDAQIEKLKLEQGQLEQDVLKLRRLFNDEETKKTSIEHEMLKITNELRDIAHRIKHSERKIQDLEETDNDMDAENHLLNSKKVFEERIAETESDMEPFLEQIELLEADIEEAAAAVAEVREMKEKLQKTMVPIQAEVDLKAESEEHYIKQIQAAEKNEQDLRKRLEQLDRRRIDTCRAFDDAMDKANEDSVNLIVPDGETNPPDFENLPDRNTVETMYKELQNKIQAELAAILPREVCEQGMADYKEQGTECKFIHKRLHTVYQTLKQAMSHRRIKFPIMQHAITLRMKNAFYKFMAVRDIKGVINIDSNRRAIDIKVDPRSNASTDGPQDLKGLSGGERSYTTSCFVMSLWEIMEAPFRCMDEFDVFMDMINRNIIMGQLVDLATNRYGHSQFIMFTPQGINELQKKERVDIFVMPKVRDMPVVR